MAQAASQLVFAAELLTMLTAAAGLVLVALRTDLTGPARWARGVLAAGFIVVGAVAFVHGARLVPTTPVRGLTAAGFAGYALLGVGSSRWRDRRPRTVLQAGLVVSAAAVGLGAVAPLGSPSAATLIAGSVAAAAALVAAGRRSIVARVAAGAAGTLLLVVLVLSVSLSAIISSSAQNSELDALAAQARVEDAVVGSTVGSAVQDARFFAADLAGAIPAATLGSLAGGISGRGRPAAAAVKARLALLAGLYPVGAVAYALPGGQLVAAGGAGAGLDRAAARLPLVAGIGCRTAGGRGAVVVTGGIAAAVAGYPVCELTTSTLLGVMVVANPLGSYLGKLQRDQGAVSLAVVTPAGVLATAGAQPPAAEMESLAARVRATGTPVRAAGDRYLDVEPLAGGSRGAPPAVLVVSTTRATAIDQQDRTERALYLIALGGTLIALLFVAAVGDRMTMGLRRLTEVADRVRRGGIGERVAISSTDEVGTLGSAFDSMMASVEAHTAALQRAAEDETRLRNRLEAVVAGMGDALVATDASGAVTDFNAAAGALTGTSAGGARGRPATEVLEIRDEDGQPVDPLVLAAGGRRSLVGATVVAGGLRVPVAVSIGSLEGAGGESAGAVMVLRDLRREQEMERMKSEFLSRIGHELRTPLTAILGYAEILLRRSVPAEQARRWHGEIYDAGTRLRRIIELLEFVASAEAGRLAVHAEPVDPRELAREVAGSWSDRLPHDVQLQRRVARLTPPVRADRKWLTLAVNELIDNAVKFSPQGGKVALTARPAPGDGAVDISVTDRGMGMDPAQRRLAFGDFVQGDSSDTRRYGGLGLGLALVERVARAHGGTVLCESSPGHGSKFTIRLPAGGPPRSDN